jgi:hypothetical protein
LICIGILQASAVIVPFVGHIKVDGTRLDRQTRLPEPMMPLYRFLPGVLINQCVLRDVGLDRVMMIGIGDQIAI